MERGLNAPVWIYNESFDEGWLGQDPRYAQTMEKFVNEKYAKRGIDIVIDSRKLCTAVHAVEAQDPSTRRQADVRMLAVATAIRPKFYGGDGRTSDLAPTLEVALPRTRELNMSC